MNRRTFWTSVLVAALVAPVFALAQDQGRRQRLSPEERRKQQMTRLQEQLGATPDEMQVITPKLEKVMAAQRDARAGGFGMGFGGGRGGQGRQGGQGGQGGGGGGVADQPETPLRKATAELRTTVENKAATPEEIAAKLAAVREARAKANADLDAARKDLLAILTPRQEAVMVAAGMLD
jgi:uncharacterized protein YhaN